MTLRDEMNSPIWITRQRAYFAVLNTNDKTLIAELVAELEALQESKVLSFGERKMLTMARDLLDAKQVSHLTLIKGGAQ